MVYGVSKCQGEDERRKRHRAVSPTTSSSGLCMPPSLSCFSFLSHTARIYCLVFSLSSNLVSFGLFPFLAFGGPKSRAAPLSFLCIFGKQLSFSAVEFRSLFWVSYIKGRYLEVSAQRSLLILATNRCQSDSSRIGH